MRALDGLDLTVKQGEIFALLGPNGAGKSTLLGILTTCLRPTAGTAQMLGRDVVRQPNEVRRVIASAAQRPGLDSWLSLEENLYFQGWLYGLPPQKIRARTARLVEGFGLEPYRAQPVASYSGGVRRARDEWGMTVFLTTHDLAEAEALSDTVCIIRAGRAVAQGAPAQLRQAAGLQGQAPTLEELFLRLTAQEG